jgi:hypothetical protein
VFTAISALLRKIPTPWRWVVEAALLATIIATGFYLFNQVQSCGYQKGSARYHEEEQKWKTERAALIARAEEKEKRVAELEPKAIAFDVLADQHRAVDAELAKKVQEVSNRAYNEEAAAEQPTDCRVRAQRVCDLLRANGVRHDCGTITRESCPGQ